MAEVLKGFGGVGGDINIEVILQSKAEAFAGVFFVIDNENGGEVQHV